MKKEKGASKSSTCGRCFSCQLCSHRCLFSPIIYLVFIVNHSPNLHSHHSKIRLLLYNTAHKVVKHILEAPTVGVNSPRFCGYLDGTHTHTDYNPVGPNFLAPPRFPLSARFLRHPKTRLCSQYIIPISFFRCD